jgi:iron complex transport system ATP-binding protein
VSLASANAGHRAAGRELLRDISLSVEPGTVHALLGPNGAGKTTLLRVLAGELKPHTGTVTLDGRPLARESAQALARRRAVMTQNDSLRFAFTAAEVAALGRLPFAPAAAGDEARIVAAALAATGVASLADRSYLRLSGGERTRVRLARVLAQVWEQFEDRRVEPRYLLLDEPAAWLDPAHQHLALRLLRRFATAGGGALVTLHDANLALAYADVASVIADGRIAASGPASSVLAPAILAPIFGMHAERLETSGGVPVLAWATSSSDSKNLSSKSLSK